MNREKEAQWASFDWEYHRHTAWVYSDLGSKRQPPDIEPIRKWMSESPRFSFYAQMGALRLG